MIVTVVSVSMPAVKEVCRFFEGLADRNDLDIRVHYIGDGVGGVSAALEDDVASADVLLTDLMGASQNVYSAVVAAMKRCRGERLAVGGMAPSLGRLGRFDAARFRMDDEDEENLHRIAESWKRASPEDIRYIFSLVLGVYRGVPGLGEPLYSGISEGVYVRDPMTLREYDDPDVFRKEHGFGTGRGTVLLTYSGNSYPTSSIDGVRLLYRRLSEFADVLPVAMNSYNVRYVPEMEAIAGNPDVIVNVLPFRFMAGPMGGDSVSATDLLRRLDSTYISPFFMTRRSRAEWESSREGLNPMEFMLSVFLPELDGGLCTLPIGSCEEVERLDSFGISVTDVVPLEDRVDRIAGKVRGYLTLRRKPNHEKRVAVISYNYPPGEGSLFGGSFLDGAGSISAILGVLAGAGYDTAPMSPDEVVDRFLGAGMLNDGQWIPPSGDVIRYGGGPEHPREVSRRWGDEPGDVMTEHGSYLIPGILDGKVFVGLQPPRSVSSCDAESYHDQTVPPHHQYLAFYEWLRDEFRADAIVHLGTHGTLEFLPGKESAMSSSCYPDMLMGDVPHVYIYYAGNPSEAMIAKRRTHACLVSYMSPPFVKSGIYGDMVELEEGIAEYRESVRTDPGRAQTVLESIRAKAESMRLPTDVDELDDELVSIRESLIPSGLHRFGEALSEEDADLYAAEAMRFPHDGIPALPGCLMDDTGSLADMIRRYRYDGTVPVRMGEDANAILEYGIELSSRASRTDEAASLLRALEGRYIEPKAGGDAMKDPDVLPSGYNTVQFNPDRIPTMSAFERGRQSAEDMISAFLEANGRYPEGAALVLWGLETSRTQGMTIGQICGYLGLRMVGSSGPFESRFEPVPLEELGRPRVDVAVSMCGFFRDMFPNAVAGLDGLFRMVSGLEEPDDMNPVKAHSSGNAAALEGMGLSPDDVQDLSCCRLFGPDEGEYGTSVTDAVGGSTWKEESELGDMFDRSLRFAYTSCTRARDVPGLLAANHRYVEMVSQVRDSTDRELIDLDHYYEFLGGLSKAVENARGEKASVFVVDGSGPRVRTQDVRRSIERGVRTRLLNPRWIDGLLQVRYHGAQKINDRFENVLGLAATTGAVESGVFSDMMGCYVTDEEMRRRVRENNNWAYMSMLERLSEANSRGYWQATEEELAILEEAYRESEDMAEAEADREG